MKASNFIKKETPASRKFFFLWISQNFWVYKVSRTIALEENCSPTRKLTLSKTLTQPGVGAVVWFPPNPKTNPVLDPNPNRKRGGCNFPRGAIVRIPFIEHLVATAFICLNELTWDLLESLSNIIFKCSTRL